MVSLLQSQGRSLRVLGCWEGAHCVYAANVDGDCQQATNQCEFERKVTTCEHIVTCIRTAPPDITNDHVFHELLKSNVQPVTTRTFGMQTATAAKPAQIPSYDRDCKRFQGIDWPILQNMIISRQSIRPLDS